MDKNSSKITPYASLVFGGVRADYSFAQVRTYGAVVVGVHG